MKKILLGLSVSATAMLAFNSAAYAQESSATTSATPEAASNSDSGDIVVTAQRKSEKLQNVGIAVSAYSGEALRTQGVTATIDIAKFTPGVSASGTLGGQGTRANIDEFTETTSQAIMDVGGATRGKAIIVLNPAEPPLIMRDTVYCLCDDADQEAIRQSVHDMAAEVQSYVPGYRLKQAVQFEHIGSNRPLRIPEMDGEFTGLKVSVFLEVEGAAHYLPAYAGNLDIMTSAALKTAEKIALRMREGAAA